MRAWCAQLLPVNKKMKEQNNLKQQSAEHILRARTEGDCAAEAIFYCPTMNSHRPRSQNTAKEQALIPEKDSRRT